jgi:hypothetical protein
MKIQSLCRSLNIFWPHAPIFFKKNYDIAYIVLDKAERLADGHLLYPILNEIYHTKIQYASNYSKIDQDNLYQTTIRLINSS